VANTFTSWIENIAGPALAVLRQNAVLPRLVRQDLGSETREQGDTIDIFKTAAGTARDITPAETPASNQDISPTKVQLVLNQWKESSFYLSDKENSEIQRGALSEQAREHIKVLANGVDTFLLRQLYAYGQDTTGTPGTTPFATNITVLGTARRILGQQIASVSDRYAVIDPLAEANLLQLANIIQADQKGDKEGLEEGRVARLLGMSVFTNQNVAVVTAGAGWATGYTIATGGAAVGVSTLSMVNATAAGAINAGDLFTAAGSSQRYAVMATVVASAAVTLALSIKPVLATALSSGDAITVVASYTPNVVFHRGAVVFASRPVAGAFGADNSAQFTDPVTGLTMRVMRTREHYQESMRFSLLYGAKAVRPEHAVRIAG